MQETSTKIRFKTYYELTKPKIWYLLVFTAFGAAITASNVYDVEISIGTWVLMIAGVAAGSAAANTLTNYHDRDIDAIMDRTCLLYTSPSPRDGLLARMPSSA